MTARRRSPGSGLDLAARIEALDDAVVAARGRLPDAVLEPATVVVERARARMALSGEYTVVALAGSTGSGKSSLFNALAGADLAVPGVRRPTTGQPMAAVWPAPTTSDSPAGAARRAEPFGRPAADARSGGAHALLDWLAVDQRHVLDRANPEAEPLGGETVATGLVLLDLPDHDSVETTHRMRAERLYERVDLLVWVVDPQKYADAALHVRYLRPLAAHADVVVLVLNHADRLTPDELERCLADLARLAAQDGLGTVPVLATSTRTGVGVAELRERLVEAARRRAAATDRVRADVRTTAGAVLAACGAAPAPVVERDARARLVDELQVAAGIPAVVEAVRRSAARRARGATGWPPTRWLASMRADPLRRLGLGTGRGTPGRPDLSRTSLPPFGPVARSRASSAVRAYCDAAMAGAPDTWVLSARARATAVGLGDALDQAVAGTALVAERPPAWWRVLGWLQWVLLGVVVVGLVWLGLLAGSTYARLPEPTTPTWWGLPAPTVLAIGGVVAGVLVALTGRLLGAVGARRAASRARRHLRLAVEVVVGERVVDPVSAELLALAQCRDAARRAAA
ncbi:GTP-binding protein HSR1 [Cellulomonas sp. WB94]|uniref:GTPase n=1 Tax=Cellulomonas sp. WB94 TaxID=2173174 RepID=UPI000D5764F2|nr:GTPase [Cellulomonas sp. WB94]PVU81941.1 GTP-binding protein HSR1 [Cellulomonas sp. WB94]